MTGVEPQTSGIKSNCTTNWATTTSHLSLFILKLAMYKTENIHLHCRGVITGLYLDWFVE